MKTFDNSLAPHFDQLLSARERELCALLGARDMAAASDELELVLAARRRLQDHAYGNCLDCDCGIDPARLAAMPVAAYCAECQAVHERKGPGH